MLSNGLCNPNGPQSENQRKIKDRQLAGSCQGTKKAIVHNDGGILNVIGMLGTVPKPGKGARRAGNLRTNRGHPEYSIIAIGQNTQQSPEDHEETCCYLDTCERLVPNAGVKNSFRVLTIEQNWKKVKRRISTRTLLENWKTVEHKSDGYTNYNWCSLYSHQRINKGTGGLGNKRTSGDHQNYIIAEIDQNIEKNPEGLRRLAVTQTPVKDHQQKLMWKSLKELNNNNRILNSVLNDKLQNFRNMHI